MSSDDEVIYTRLSMKRHKNEGPASFIDCGGQGDAYRMDIGRNSFVLKLYLRQPEAQERLRQLAEKFDGLTSIPGPLERSRVVDWGSALYDTRMVPAALFPYVTGKPLFSDHPDSDCGIARGIGTEQQRRKLIRELVEAVNYLHRNSVVHADLSPKNVLINEDASELTVIDIDGAGILEDRGSSWRSPPLVAGLTGMSGFPAPAETEEDKVFLETDYWWTAMLVFYIATSVHPFFFLSDIDPPTLSELTEILEETENAEWPPEFGLASSHSRFDTRIDANAYEWVVQRVRETVPTNAFFRTFGVGYSERKARVPVGFLLRELVSLWA